LLLHQSVEVSAQGHHGFAQSHDIVGVRLIDRRGKCVEASKRVRLLEAQHQTVVRVHAEVFDDYASTPPRS
jgi:sugar lactone lactonase YvrE